jgi:hypothetical protein
MIPMPYPQSVEEYIELGLHGFAMSRFAGLPVGFKALADTVESSGSIQADAMNVSTILPQDFVFPEGGVHARLSRDTLGVQARKQEALMQDYKIYAAIAYARANRLNRVTIGAPPCRSARRSLPVLANITEFGATLLFTVEQLRLAGVAIALYPLSAFRAANKAAESVYGALRRDGTQANLVETMQTRAQLYECIGYHAYEQRLDVLFSAAAER